MNSLFGDATTVGTPSIHGTETGSLMRPGSPIGSARGIGSSAIPGLQLDPEMDIDAKSQGPTGEGDDRTVTGWLSRVVNRGRAGSSASGQGRYAPLGQQDDGYRN